MFCCAQPATEMQPINVHRGIWSSYTTSHQNMEKLSESKPPLGYPAGGISSIQRLGGTRNAFSRRLRPVCHGRHRACTDGRDRNNQSSTSTDVVIHVSGRQHAPLGRQAWQELLLRSHQDLFSPRKKTTSSRRTLCRCDPGRRSLSAPSSGHVAAIPLQ